jgi:hypothetical protein
MAKVEASTRTGSDAMGRAIDDTVADRPTYPSGTTFIRTEIDDFGECVAEHARRGGPIVIAYPDGEERYFVPQPHPRQALSPVSRFWRRWRR